MTQKQRQQSQHINIFIEYPWTKPTSAFSIPLFICFIFRSTPDVSMCRQLSYLIVNQFSMRWILKNQLTSHLLEYRLQLVKARLKEFVLEFLLLPLYIVRTINNSGFSGLSFSHVQLSNSSFLQLSWQATSTYGVLVVVGVWGVRNVLV